jgi:SAM-dependent methyltransferase
MIILPATRQISAQRIRQIKQQVRKAEEFLVKLGFARRAEWGVVNRYPSGPNRPIYQTTSPEALLRFLEKQNLPRNLKVADLGSGLGTACFAATELFDEIVGFEIDSVLIAASRLLRWKLGISRKVLKFYWRNFLKANLSSFDLLYVFRPFIENFEDVMSSVLNQLRPGTRIIFTAYPPGNMLPIDQFSLQDCSKPFYMYQKLK